MHPFEKAVVFLMEQAASGHLGLAVPRVEAGEILNEIKSTPVQGFVIDPPAELDEFNPEPGDKLVIDPEDLVPAEEVTDQDPEPAEPKE